MSDGYRRPAAFAVLVVGLAALATPARGAAPPAGERALLQQGFEHAYNLDYEEAVALMRKAVAIAPEEAGPHRSLATVYWLRILFLRGSVTVDHYLGQADRPDMKLPVPPPELAEGFATHVRRAIELAERRVRRHPRDAEAHYDLGAAEGLLASYTATIEGRIVGSLGPARRAYRAHEQVLRLTPERSEAGLVVGTYRYAVASLSLPLRLMAHVVGFGGGRERGLRMIEEAAARPSDARVEARFALVLLYNREARYLEAMRTLEGLQREYPRNRLLWLEAGATAIRARRFTEAERHLTTGFARLAADPRARFPGEGGVWYYKLGAARAGLGKTAAAHADLRRALVSDTFPWVKGRAHLELGKLAARAGDRAAAEAEYRRGLALCERDNDAVCGREARRLLKSASG
jgi:tetratricopeptide (TPR) repeat protein